MSKPLQAVISRENPEKVFDLIEKVGGGTYGDVFKARVIATGDLAAVKIVKVEPVKGSDLRTVIRRFQNHRRQVKKLELKLQPSATTSV